MVNWLFRTKPSRATRKKTKRVRPGEQRSRLKNEWLARRDVQKMHSVLRHKGRDRKARPCDDSCDEYEEDRDDDSGGAIVDNDSNDGYDDWEMMSGFPNDEREVPQPARRSMLEYYTWARAVISSWLRG